jgi:hypothetical protein
MTITATRARRRQLERDNAKWPVELVEVPKQEWVGSSPPEGMTQVFRSRDFLVQVYSETGPVLARLSIGRTSLEGGRWRDGISWDELQRLKRECGFGAYHAVEVFPADCDLVNVANLRHLWVLLDAPTFAWRRGG